MKTLTLGEFIDNMEKNGLHKAIGSLWKNGLHEDIDIDTEGIFIIRFRHPDSKPLIYSACAIGQAFINSGIRVVKGSSNESVWGRFSNTVVELNDESNNSITDIAKTVREQFKEYLSIEIQGQEFDFTPYIAEGAHVTS